MPFSTEEIITQVKEKLYSNVYLDDACQAICELLHDNFDKYDWVGFYWSDTKQANMLKLGSFVGEPTEHVYIPFGKGICGQVAISEQTIIVDDVSRSDNYIACSIDVKSEIVVPILKDNRFIGQIDIDSHHLNAFNTKDQALLETICNLIAERC